MSPAVGYAPDLEAHVMITELEFKKSGSAKATTDIPLMARAFADLETPCRCNT